MNLTRTLAAAAVMCAGSLAAGAAQARDVDVQWSITIGSPVYARPAPVYSPQPVYAPAPVYRQAPAWGQRVVVVVPAPVRAVVYQPRHQHRNSRWDVDGDGIPNRYDRVYNPRWDRDGDGVPNRRDAYPQRAGRH